MKQVVSPEEMEVAVFSDDKQTRDKNIDEVTEKMNRCKFTLAFFWSSRNENIKRKKGKLSVYQAAYISMSIYSPLYITKRSEAVLQWGKRKNKNFFTLM